MGRLTVFRSGLCTLALLLAGTAHAVITFDDNVTPDILFGSGVTNGSFTVDRQGSVELGLRGKLRFPPVERLQQQRGRHLHLHVRRGGRRGVGAR